MSGGQPTGLLAWSQLGQSPLGPEARHSSLGLRAPSCQVS